MSTARDLQVVPPAEAPAAPLGARPVSGVHRTALLSRASPSLDHLPGEGGILAGVSTLIEWTRRGAASMLDQRLFFGPVFRTQFGLAHVVGVTDPKLVLEILRNERGAFSPALTWPDLGAGVDGPSPALDLPGTPDYELYDAARALLQPAFSPAAMSGYVDMATPLFEHAVDMWTARGRVAFKAEVHRLVGRVSARAFLGVEDAREGQRLETRLAAFGYTRLRDALQKRIARRHGARGDDLFSRVCEAGRGVSPADEDGLVQLFIGVMHGAFDTMASGLAGMAYLLARHPEWQEQLRAEVLSLEKRRASYDDTSRLEAVDRVWRETLRLFPVTCTVPRKALRPVALGPWRIPDGAVVFALIGPAFRDVSCWKDPEHFDPDRFSSTTLAQADKARQETLVAPFGTSVHGGLGIQLASAEVKAFWVSMLTRCRFHLEREYEARHTMIPVGTVSGEVPLAIEPL
jgi:cytochrome P450